MLGTTITLTTSVDPEEVYTRWNESEPNKSTYIGPAHSAVSRQTINFYRTPAKKSGNSYGVEKAAIKVTLDVDVDTVDGAGTTKAPLIAEVSFAMPVGTTDAEKLLAINKLQDLLADATNVMEPLLEQLRV